MKTQIKFLLSLGTSKMVVVREPDGNEAYSLTRDARTKDSLNRIAAALTAE